MKLLASGMVLLALAAGLPVAAADTPFAGAPPRVGDVARYNVTLLRANADSETVLEGSHAMYAMEQMPAVVSGDADGKVHVSYPLALSFPSGYRRVLHRDATTGEALAMEEPYSFRGDGNLFQDALTSLGGTTVTFADVPWLPCGADTVLQRGVADPTDPFILQPQGCSVYGFGWVPTGATFSRVRTDRHGGEDAPAFADAAGLRIFWFTPSLPYPLRMVFPAQEDGTFYVIDLVAFHRGGGPVLWEQNVALPPPPPALANVELGRFGPDDAGLGMAWPLHAAFAAARDMAGDTRVRDYLANHTDAYMRAAHYEEQDVRDEVVADVYVPSNSYHERRWSFSLVDDDELLDVIVKNTTYGSDPTWDAIVSAVGKEPASVLSLYSAYAHQGEHHGAFLAIDRAMPAPRDVVALWSAYSPAAASLDHPLWGFEVCEDFCHPFSIRVEAGRETWLDRTNNLGVTEVPVNSTYAKDMLVAADGHALAIYRSASAMADAAVKTVATALDDLPSLHELLRSGVLQKADAAALAQLRAQQDAPGEPGPASPGPTQPSAAPALAAAVGAGPPAAAFGVAFGVTAGLGLVGLAVWKLLSAFGLFSRLRSGKVLEHPVRAGLMHLIEANPGIHLRELMRRSGKEAGAIRHHLGKLTAAGLVASRPGPGYTCYFVRRGTDHRVMDAARLLKSQGARTILAHALREPGIASSRLQAAAGISAGTLEYHAKRLAAAGLLAAHVEAHQMRLATTALGEQSLAALWQSPAATTVTTPSAQEEQT
ncbi:MAG: hypothetical protein LC620_05730 [Halobacteriales archaeon]|nr:hypothetical protein [Halobacteriales archaeon]